MNLYKLTRTDKYTYGDFRAVIVAAESDDAASLVSPATSAFGWEDESGNDTNDPWKASATERTGWCISPDMVIVEWIGIAAEHIRAGVILADNVGS